MMLCTPLGESISCPSMDDILDLLKQEDEYWNCGCGTASLSVDSVEKCDEFLVFYRNHEYGYVILLFKDNDNYAYFNEENDSSLVIVHNISGEPFPIPHCFYVDYIQAKSILSHFLQTGTIPYYEKWRSISDIFDYDAYLDSDEYYNGVDVFRK